MRNEEFIRLSLKPELSPDEAAQLEAHLAAHPDERAVWDEERALGRALQSLPDVPVSSNFTARVLAAVDLEELQAARARPSRMPWLRPWWRRLSWATGVVLAAVIGGQQYFRATQSSRLVNDVAFVSKEAVRLPSPEVLRDFDVIESMRHISPASDDELFLALQ